MQGHYNRKERRNLAKRLGLKKENETQAERQERTSRTITAGKSIHQQFLMQSENSVRNQEAEIEAKRLNSFIEKFGAEVGTRMMEENRISAEKKARKAAEKKNNR